MDEVKTDNSEMIARLTRERDELQRRLEKWQRNEVQIATNQQVARLIRERDEARAEVEQLRSELAYYRRDNEKLTNALAWEHNESENAMDAKRYRWLRTFATWINEDYWIGSKSIHYRWNAGEFESVDAAIDAAMEGE